MRMPAAMLLLLALAGPIACCPSDVAVSLQACAVRTVDRSNWNAVQPGESFNFVVKYDETYQKREVVVSMREGANGRSESTHPGWKWSATFPHTDSF